MIRNGIKRVVRAIGRRLTGEGGASAAHAPAADGGRTEPGGQGPADVAAPSALSFEVEGDEAVRAVHDGALLVDVREPNELYAGHAADALLVPMRQVDARLSELPRDRRLVVYCAAGVRSANVVEHLRAVGYKDAQSLAGGFGAWAAAGGATVRPPTGTAFPIAGKVKVDGRPGTVQAITETPEGMRYTVQIVEGDRVERATDVGEARLVRG